MGNDSFCIFVPHPLFSNVASNKMRYNWTKIAQYLIKYKQKRERAVKKSYETDEKRESDDEIKI
jgi:hypothetical protein